MRRILHVDMDAFFVGVELRRRPELVGRPVVVGGTGPRGVVAAASYEARAFGVHSAQPMAIARRKCPDAVVLPGDMAAYQQASAEIMAILGSVTPLVEPLSLDEAFLDVSGSWRPFGSATAVAHELRARVLEETELNCCVGVSAVKFIAKLASQDAKPRPGAGGPTPGPGVVVVAPGSEDAYLAPLPVGRLWGVGPAVGARLTRIGVVTVGDLARLDVETLRACVGTANGTHLHQLANGIDHRGVEPDRDLKSIGHEETFPADISDRRRLERELAMLSEAVGRRLGAAEVSARTVTIKIRFADFATISRSFTSGVATDSGMEIGRRAVELFGQVDISSGVRLVGVSTSGLVSEQVEQLALDVAAGDAQIEQGAGPRRQEADRAIDEIRDRFGTGAIAMGLSADGFDTHRPIWGPDERGEPDGP